MHQFLDSTAAAIEALVTHLDGEPVADAPRLTAACQRVREVADRPAEAGVRLQAAVEAVAAAAAEVMGLDGQLIPAPPLLAGVLPTSFGYGLTPLIRH